MKTQKRVILIQPGNKEGFGHRLMPVSLLSVAGYLLEYNKDKNPVEIFDARNVDYKKLNLDNVVMVCFAIMTGSPIKDALEVARYIRKKDPNIIIVCGGIHGSLLPEQTVRNKFIDVVIKGEGEATILELVQRLNRNQNINDVKGIAYKDKQGNIYNNSEREYLDMDSIPFFPYELLDKSLYVVDVLTLQTSRGCPFRCSFCYNTAFPRSWRYKSAKRIADEVEHALKHWDSRFIGFSDDLFFVHKKRVEEFCHEVIQRGLRVRWSAMCRSEYVCKWDEPFLQLLEKSGCRSLGIGAESGSDKILQIIDKDNKSENVIDAVRILKKYKIKPIMSFMCGIPGETKEDLLMTVKLMKQCAKENPNFESNGLFIFTPYPGTPLYTKAVELGFKEPQSLEEWGEKFFGDESQTPWFNEKYKKYMASVSTAGWLIYAKPNPHIEWNAWYFTKYALKATVVFLARLRWKLSFFELPIELNMYQNYVKQYR